MISAGILCTGLTALVRVHTSSVRGLHATSQMTTAMEIGRQRAELFTTQKPDALLLPSCPTATQIGCRVDDRTLAPPKACTSWIAGPDVPMPSGSNDPRNFDPRGYRMDVVIGSHPDTTAQADGLLATVSVCWSDEQGHVHEVQSRRLLVPES